MNKKIIPFLLGAAVLFHSCDKSDPLTGPKDTSLAYVSFTNANSSAAGAKAVNVFIDGAKSTNANFISQYATVAGTYIGVQPGNRNVVVRDTLSPGTTTYYNSNITVTGGNSYSFYLYDVIAAGALKGILLNTDRTPDGNSANAKLRFLNLSPNSPGLDFWLVRREATVNKDSVMLYNGVPFLGNVATPNITALSAFNSIRGSNVAGLVPATAPASDYILRIKLANSATIVASTAATNLIPGRNYTVFARGIYPASALTIMLNN